MRNLILSVLHNFQYPVVEPFIESLQDSGFNGDLVIFISEATSRATRYMLKKKGAILISYQTTYPFIDSYADVFTSITPSITLNNYRFLFYLRYLKEHPSKYDRIMLTDIRDVFFQKDIFKEISKDKIYFFLEDPSEVFRTSPLNYKWCLEANGAAVTNQIVNKNVSCAGTIIGGYTSILAYLDYFQMHLKFRKELPWGIDQGLHNGYVHTALPPDAAVIPNSYPLILTLGACANYKQGSNGWLQNEVNMYYCVVHQWDRFGDLMIYIKRKYVGSRFIQLFKNLLFLILP